MTTHLPKRALAPLHLHPTRSAFTTLWRALALAWALMVALASPSAARSDTFDAPPAISADGADGAQAAHPRVQGLRIDDTFAPLMFYYTPDYEERMETLRGEVAKLRDKVLIDFPAAPLPAIHIYLLPDIERYFEAQERGVGSPRWASGLALLGEDVILVRLLPAVVGGKVEIERTLAHELSHVILHNMTGRRPLPTWFVEGLAMYQTEPWDMERSQRLGEAIKVGKVLPLWDFERGFPPDHLTAQLAYAESAHFFYWLDEQYGRAVIRDMLASLHAGVGFGEAFERAAGEPFGVVEERWRSGLAVGQTWLSIAIEGGSVAAMVVGLALLMLYARKRRRAALARMEEMGKAEPSVNIPSHLRRFGPFTGVSRRATGR
jgi:hypothetical protein